MTIKRGKSDDGGRTTRIDPPTFTESLLMEMLLQIIPMETSTDRLVEILRRAGFTDEEIEERAPRTE